MSKRENDKQTNFPLAPEHLSERSKQLYDFNVGKGIRAPGQEALLVGALECLDLADKSLQTIIEDGLAPKSERSKIRRAHPCFRTYIEAQAQYLKIFKMLDLDRNMYHAASGRWTEYV